MHTCRWTLSACCQVFWSERGRTGPAAPAAPLLLVRPALRDTKIRQSQSSTRRTQGEEPQVFLTSDVHLSGNLHGGRQVPHLDAAVAMATEQVAAGPRADATRAFTLMDHEGGDGRPVYRAHLAHPNTHTHTHTDLH